MRNKRGLNTKNITNNYALPSLNFFAKRNIIHLMSKYHKMENLKISPMTVLPEEEETAPDTTGYIFRQEVIDTISELGSVFQQIHNRLTSEGYSIIDGKLINSKGEVEYERPKKYREGYHQGN